MPAPKKPTSGKHKMKDLNAKKVSSARARKVTGGRDVSTGNATGRRAYKPV